MKKLPILSILLIAGVAVAYTVNSTPAAKSTETKFTATLSGDREVPKVTTRASGDVKVWVDPKTNEIRYRLDVRDIKDASGAHLHLAPMGKNGPPVAMLWEGPQKKGQFSGVLSEGMIKPNTLAGPLKGKPSSDLINDIRAGRIYVNVHTKAHPDGELRGQLH